MGSEGITKHLSDIIMKSYVQVGVRLLFRFVLLLL